jgi:hypothetical protein
MQTYGSKRLLKCGLVSVLSYLKRVGNRSIVHHYSCETECRVGDYDISYIILCDTV